MSEIVDNGEYWKLIIFPDLKPKENVDELATRGFKARLGEDENGEFKIMDIDYLKSKFTLDRIFKFTEQIMSCSRCDALNKERMKINKIGAGPADANVSQSSSAPYNNNVISSSYGNFNREELKRPGAFKDILAETLFNSMFTDPGKFFLATMMGDNEMMDKVLPKDEKEMESFMDNLLGFFAGEVDLRRNPDEIRDYFNAIRKPKEDDDIPTRSLKRAKNKSLPFNGTLVY